MSSACVQDFSLPSSFHPLVREWFTETYGKPTAIQAASWPVIAEGSHALVLAPTGSGKTLAAFLAALSRFCAPPGGSGESEYAAGELSVLYVSPLKALNEDIRRNLLEPLSGIRACFEKSGVPFPAIRAETRSGDTPQPERRRFLVSPPSILALTPESLAIILLNPKGRKVLASVKYVILDEIHSALGTKRGSFLSCQIERLALVAGEFQRVSLSATVKNPDAAAEFTGGIKRAVRIIAPREEKRIELAVEFSGGAAGEDASGKNGEDAYSNGEGESGPYRFLIDLVLKKIEKKENAGNGKQSPLLVFTDSRRRAERIAFLVNRKAERVAAYAHHGSLAKEIRRAVEKRLAEGSLSCVIATSSLELGIDIGGIDEVILAGSPSSVSQTLQRIGRSGHGAGRISRGTLVPFHRMDLLLAAGLAEAAAERDIEEIRPIENPLDILAQIILSLCTEKDYNVDGLYELIRGFYIFRNLRRPSYDAVIAMLTETYRRVRGIRPRLYFDKTDGTLSAAPGALELLYTQGGVIANRGYYSLRIAGGGEGGGTKIGELDEEFVWERKTGDCFEFGTRGWRITAIGPEAVQAVPLEKPADYIPFWKAEKAFGSPVLARHVLAVLERYSAAAESGRPFWEDGIIPGFSRDAAEHLEKFLDAQYAALGSLPGKNRINVEIIREAAAKRGGRGICQAVLHCFRGGAVNYPFSLAVAQSLEEKLASHVDVFSGDNGILLVMPGVEESGAEALLRDALEDLDKDGGGGISRGERLFRKRLESSSVFGAAWREAAERSLVISRPLFGKRAP
ncbi:MAG: DEAD/DEAH box helicase, partial [Treponema sp.]|nr:DEAD/DEAH box helicase [Treponema sp.]